MFRARGARQRRQCPAGEPGHGRGVPGPRGRSGIPCRNDHTPLRSHRLADLEPPTNSEHVRATLRGIRRTVGAAPTRKAPVLAEAARGIGSFRSRGPPQGLRDRALLLLGFAGAFRRSELVALDVADLEETEDGFKIIIRRSKLIRRAMARRSPSPAGSRPAP